MLNSSRIDKTKLVAFSSPGGHKQRATRIDEFCWSMERCCCTWKWARRDTFRRVPAKNLEGARTTFSLSFSPAKCRECAGGGKALNITQHRIKSYFEVPASWRNSDKFCLICDDWHWRQDETKFRSTLFYDDVWLVSRLGKLEPLQQNLIKQNKAKVQ